MKIKNGLWINLCYSTILKQIFKLMYGLCSIDIKLKFDWSKTPPKSINFEIILS